MTRAEAVFEEMVTHRDAIQDGLIHRLGPSLGVPRELEFSNSRIGCALLFQFAGAMRAFGASGSQTLADAYDQWASNGIVSPNTSFGAVAVHSCNALPIPLENVDSGVWLATPDSMISDDLGHQSVLNAGAEAIHGAGFGHILDSGPGIVFLNRTRDVTDSALSWTVSSLPGSIFIDYFDSPLRVGEDLLHESAHSVLNDLFRTRGISLSMEPEFYSPWKGTKRSAFSMAHTGFAFGAVVAYCRWVLENDGVRHDLDEVHKSYFLARLASESRRAESAVPAFRTVLDGIQDEEVRAVIASHFDVIGAAG